jgi:large subunit ribosomal protein L24
MKIKTGDMVIVLSGDDKGKKGKVLKALPSTHQVLVEGVNVHKKHLKPSQANPKGQIIDKTLPIDVSNVALIDPKTQKPTRVGYKLKGEEKIRVAKKSGAEIK